MALLDVPKNLSNSRTKPFYAPEDILGILPYTTRNKSRGVFLGQIVLKIRLDPVLCSPPKERHKEQDLPCLITKLVLVKQHVQFALREPWIKLRTVTSKEIRKLRLHASLDHILVFLLFS